MGMMAQTLPPIPASGGGQASTEATPLAQPPEQSQGNPAGEQAKTIMRQLMDQRRANEAMAAQYPAAAKELRAANDSLKDAMLKIVKEIQQQPGTNPAPPVGPG